MHFSKNDFMTFIMLLHLRNLIAEDIIVNTQYGPVQGVKKSSILGRNYFNFQGIPYMKAPLGKLRFADAQPSDSWTEPFDVAQKTPAYHQFKMFTSIHEGQEDAGVINVYTPNLTPQKLLAVMVFIHGGGFVAGSGGPDFYGPDYFMQKDIVLVTFNYRLGVIGFLSLKNPELKVPGNTGLKDQIFALKWIQKNIASFGGDPNAVTLFGQSAGAASVHLHMTSEQSQGLFHRGIMMSGVAFNPWAFAPSSNWNERLLKNLNASFSNDNEILDFLENVHPTNLVEASFVQSPEETYGTLVMFPFGPVVEDHDEEKSFLKESPIIASRNAWGNEIDCMIGMTSFESLIDAALENEPGFENYINFPRDNFAFFAPLNELKTDKNSEKAKSFGKMIKENFYGKLNPSLSNLEPYYYFRSDYHTTHGLIRAVKSRLKYGKNGKTFLYRFDGDTSLNYVKRNVSKKEKLPGAAHGDDLFYLFTSTDIEPPEEASKEFEMIQQMVNLWTNFAISGSPSEIWSPVSNNTEGPLDCFNIANDGMKMIPMPEYERMKIWDEIYEKAEVDLI